jgi:hypothetical protein
MKDKCMFIKLAEEKVAVCGLTVDDIFCGHKA